MRGRLWLASCRIGLGRALVVADADMLTDPAWVLPDTPRGHERHLRTADNPLIVASWLDQLAGVRRERTDRPVAWIAPPVYQLRVLAGSCVPILAGLAMGLALLYRSRRPPTNLSTGLHTVNNTRTKESGGP
jgi:hypothetical protein